MSMLWLRDLPVRRKLAVVILATCSVVLVLACTILAAFHFVQARRALAGEMTIRARIVGQSSRAALAFLDDEEARRSLETLSSDPQVRFARLFDVDGHVFAEYVRLGLAAVAANGPGPDGFRFENDALVVVEPIRVGERRIGTIRLESELTVIHAELWVFGGFAVLVLLGSLAVAGALSSRLQRTVSGPIQALAATARGIAERKDFTLRAPQAGRDEVGQLTDAFNEMLGGIEEREGALRTANETLRGEIAERRLAEESARAQLSRLELLNAITRAVGERQDLHSIFQIVIASVEEHLPLDFGFVCLHEPATHSLVVSEVSSRSEALARRLALEPQSRIVADPGGLARCLAGQLVFEGDTSRESSPLSGRLAEEGLQSLVLAPLLVENKVFGVLGAARRQPGGFSSGECQFLRQLSEHVALAAHQSHLYSALQQAYDDLRQSQAAAMQHERLRALGQMASGVAHDINNAITPVAIYVEMLLEQESALSDGARERLEIIQRAVGDVAETVVRMREFSRPRSPQAALEPLSLNDLVRQVVDLTRARWSDMPLERGIVVRVGTDLAEGLPTVLGVESEIRDALTNLVFNGVDAMPDGGEVTVRTRAISVGSTPSAPPGQVLVEVSDTGVGMDEETRVRCLEPFFTTKGERGTGLGLAMVYGTAQRHRAELEIDSVVGVGTTVRLLFPAPRLQESAREGHAVAPQRAQLRVLLVDDDPLVLRALSTALERDGQQVVAAPGGQEGIDAFRAAHESGAAFSVVISDLGMPYVDGRAVAAAIKSISPATPIILLTGWGERPGEDLPANVDRVLGKPAQLRALREAVAELVDSPRS